MWIVYILAFARCDLVHLFPIVVITVGSPNIVNQPSLIRKSVFKKSDHQGEHIEVGFDHRGIQLIR